MPFYDLTCKNNHEQIDRFLAVGERPPCPECGEATETLWRTSSNVVGDECDVDIKHGLCWDDGTPRRFTSKAEIAKVAKEKGLTSYVEHVPDPRSGSDKSVHTVRWV